MMMAATEELVRKAGIPPQNVTMKKLSLITVIFVDSPSEEFINKIETSIQYYNQ